MPKLSVVIPVYNTALYLKTCLDSVLNQGFNDIEIILIDNFCTDGSSEIITEYGQKHCNIKCVKTPEFVKASISRQFGLQFVNGEFLTYVDSDDSVKPGIYEHMFEVQKVHEADIVVCNYDIVDDKSTKQSYSDMKDELIDINKLGYKHYFDNYFGMPRPNNYLWSRIIKTELIKDNDIYFPPVDISEDTIFSMLCSVHAKRIAHIKQSYYNYFQRENSTLRETVRRKNISESYVFAFDCVVKYVTEHNLTAIFADILPSYAATRVRSILFYNELVGKDENSSYGELAQTIKNSSMPHYLKSAKVDDVQLAEKVKRVLQAVERV